MPQPQSVNVSLM